MGSINVARMPMNDHRLAVQIARLAADSAQVELTVHARHRMRKRRILITQVIEVLQRGSVVEHAHQNIHGHWQCTLEKVVAGDRIKVVAALEERADGEVVIVITVMN